MTQHEYTMTNTMVQDGLAKKQRKKNGEWGSQWAPQTARGSYHSPCGPLQTVHDGPLTHGCQVFSVAFDSRAFQVLPLMILAIKT